MYQSIHHLNSAYAQSLKNEQITNQQLFTGTVIGYQQDYYLVQVEDEVVSAKQAFGCTFEPEKDDLVCIFISDTGLSHIIHILSRPNDNAGVLHSKNGIVLSSTKNVDIKCNQLNQHANRITIFCQQSITNAKQLISRSGSIKTIFDSWESKGKNLFQSLKSSNKQVEGLDQTSAGRLTLNVSETLKTRSNRASLVSKKDMRIDGERVHMG